MTRSATYEELVVLVGELDMPTISRLLETHASVDDVVEAIDAIEHPEAARYTPTSGRVREILFEAIVAFDTSSLALEAAA